MTSTSSAPMDDVSIAEMKTQEEFGNKHMIPPATNINRVIGDIYS